MKTTMPRSASLAALAAMVAADGLLDGAVCRLFTTNIAPDATIDISLLEAATFDGYAASAALTWGTPYNTPNGGRVDANRVQFTCTGDTVADVIRGYMVTTAGGSPELLFWEKFDEPVYVTEDGDAVVVVPSLALEMVAE